MTPSQMSNIVCITRRFSTRFIELWPRLSSEITQFLLPPMDAAPARHHQLNRHFETISTGKSKWSILVSNKHRFSTKIPKYYYTNSNHPLRERINYIRTSGQTRYSHLVGLLSQNKFYIPTILVLYFIFFNPKWMKII